MNVQVDLGQVVLIQPIMPWLPPTLKTGMVSPPSAVVMYRLTGRISNEKGASVIGLRVGTAELVERHDHGHGLRAAVENRQCV